MNEIYLLGGPLDGQVLQTEELAQRIQVWEQLDDLVPCAGRIGVYHFKDRFVYVRWDLPYDGSLETPEAFYRNRGRLVMNVRRFEYRPELAEPWPPTPVPIESQLDEDDLAILRMDDDE